MNLLEKFIEEEVTIELPYEPTSIESAAREAYENDRIFIVNNNLYLDSTNLLHSNGHLIEETMDINNVDNNLIEFEQKEYLNDEEIYLIRCNPKIYKELVVINETLHYSSGYSYVNNRDIRFFSNENAVVYYKPYVFNNNTKEYQATSYFEYETDYKRHSFTISHIKNFNKKNEYIDVFYKNSSNDIGFNLKFYTDGRIIVYDINSSVLYNLDHNEIEEIIENVVNSTTLVFKNNPTLLEPKVGNSLNKIY